MGMDVDKIHGNNLSRNFSSIKSSSECLLTNDIHTGASIGESSCRVTAREVHAVGWIIGLRQAGNVVVVAGIRQRVPKNEERWHCSLRSSYTWE